VVPNAGGAEYAGELDVPIQCGGVAVIPGDWVVGDEDGVVVIPANYVTNVLKRAELLAQIEKQIERAVRRGQDLASILRYEEALERKSREPALPQMRFVQH
jgi:regulator of RNase E activity RraA